MIVVDVQALQSDAHRASGIGRYVAAISRQLATAGDYWFAYNDSLPVTSELEQWRNDADVGERLLPFSDLRGRHVDVLLIGSPFEDLDAGQFLPPVRAERTTAICYDLIPYRFPDHYLTDRGYAGRYRARLSLLTTADHLFAVSEATARDLVDLAGFDRCRTTVVGTGVDPKFRRDDADDLAARLAALQSTVTGLQASFILVPGGIEWLDNIDGLIDAFGSLPDDLRLSHQLVITCPTNPGQKAWVESLAAAANVADRVLITGFVEDDVLIDLYRSAELVVVPSHYQGFGLTILEARRCGARVICSDRSSLPEALPEPQAWFDPSNPDAIAATIKRALTDPSFARLLDRVPDPGWSWKRTADSIAAVHHRLAATLTPVGRTNDRRRRLAFATVLPPTLGEVADHSARLAEDFIANDIDVDVFAERAALSSYHRFPVFELASLPIRWATERYDNVLYALGNSPDHRRLIGLLSVIPGDVLLHDIQLHSLYHPGQVRALVTPAYKGAIDGALWSAPIARLARQVLVRSEHAAELLHADSGVIAIRVEGTYAEEAAHILSHWP